MTEPRKKTDWAIIGAILILAVFLLPILYVLSIGPVVWLDDRGYLPDWLGAMYMPLEDAAEAIPQFRHLVEWYISFWER